MSEPLLHVVLYQPDIPQNTGNIGRTCVAVGAKLWLIRPLGFRLDEKHLRRAGMDYWQHVQWQRWANWAAFQSALPVDGRLWFVEQGGTRRYDEAKFAKNDYLVFGRESAGLPRALWEANPERHLRIPMLNTEARSLNLSNCVALVLYEALRQQGFAGEIS